jgi:hypothetical protein
MMPSPLNSLILELASLIKTCAETSQHLNEFRKKPNSSRNITISLLVVECEVISLGLEKLERILRGKPDVLDRLAGEDIMYFEFGIKDSGSVAASLHEVVGVLKDGLEKGMALSEDESSRYEERLGGFVDEMRERGLCVCFLLACVRLYVEFSCVLFLAFLVLCC